MLDRRKGAPPDATGEGAPDATRSMPKVDSKDTKKDSKETKPTSGEGKEAAKEKPAVEKAKSVDRAALKEAVDKALKEAVEKAEAAEGKELESVEDLEPGLDQIEDLDPSSEPGRLEKAAALTVGAVGVASWGITKFGSKVALRTVDRVGSWVDGAGRKLINFAKKIYKKGEIPFVSKFLMDPIMGGIIEDVPKTLDWLQEKTGFKKRLGERLKEKGKERKKVMDKLLSDLRKEEKTWEKGLDAKEKKSKQKNFWKERFGDDLGEEVDRAINEEREGEDKDKKGDAKPAKEAAPTPDKAAA